MEPFTVTTLTGVLGRMLPEPHAGFLSGILFGTRSAMSKGLVDAFVTTGTIHIVALSGQNLSIFTGVLANRLAAVFSRRLSSLLIIFFLVWFLWFVGSSPSLVRAVIMGSLTLLSVIFGRRNVGLLSLVLAVCIMLALNPSWIGDLSFQLSVLATLGIILFGGKGNINSKWWSFIVDDLRVTLAAQLFTTPLIFFQFHRISLIAPLTNVLIGWTMAYLMGLGWVAAILGYIWLPLGILPAWGSWLLMTYVIWVVEVTAGLPLASVVW